MDNLLLLSMLAATVAIPALSARARSGRRALASTLLLLLGFAIAYAFLVSHFYADHYVPEPLAP